MDHVDYEELGKRILNEPYIEPILKSGGKKLAKNTTTSAAD